MGELAWQAVLSSTLAFFCAWRRVGSFNAVAQENMRLTQMRTLVVIDHCLARARGDEPPYKTCPPAPPRVLPRITCQSFRLARGTFFFVWQGPCVASRASRHL